MKHRISTVIIITSLLGFASCAYLQTAQKNATAWSNTPGGKVTLATVQTAANLFEPQYAGVLGVAINSLQTATVPTPAAAQSIIASVTGAGQSDAKVATLAAAVISAASQAPTPNQGLAAAAATVNK